jgi:hypothetical protein
VHAPSAETSGRLDPSVNNLMAYSDCFGLGLAESDVEELGESVQTSLASLSRLWRHSLEGVGTSLAVLTTGRR